MKNYQLVLEETSSKKRQQINLQAHDFSSAASSAYLRRHAMAYAGTGWKIISLAETGWQVVKLP